MKDLEKEKVDKIRDDFRNRMIHQRIKFESKEFYKRQAEFIAGTISILTIMEYHPSPSLVVAVMGNRPICESYKL